MDNQHRKMAGSRELTASEIYVERLLSDAAALAGTDVESLFMPAAMRTLPDLPASFHNKPPYEPWLLAGNPERWGVRSATGVNVLPSLRPFSMFTTRADAEALAAHWNRGQLLAHVDLAAAEEPSAAADANNG